MRKDWSRCAIPPNSDTCDLKQTEKLFGISFTDSAFGKVVLSEESAFMDENFELSSEIHLVNDYENYIQDGEYEKKESVVDSYNIRDGQYHLEFNDWRERGFRLWTIYPSASYDSPILKAWHSEIDLLRNEFKQRIEALPF